VPDSVRLIDPTMPEGATLIPPPPAGWFDPQGNAIREILNHYVNFGWEYVWHCHILSHEEMDMMHTLVFAVPPTAPTLSTPTLSGNVNNPRVNLSWTDNSLKEAGFAVQRASDADFTIGLTTFNVAPNTLTFQDSTVARNGHYWYRVFAIGSPVGDLQTAGFPTMSADSVSNTVDIQVGAVQGTPTSPTNLTATLQSGPQVSLTWTDNATNETGFLVERCAGAGCTDFAQIAVVGPRNNTGSVTYVDTTVTFGNDFLYRVRAANSGGQSAFSNTASVTVPPIPEAPTGFTITNQPANGRNSRAILNWASATDPTGFTIQRAENATFTTNAATFTVAGSLRTLTQTVRDNTVYYYRIRANNDVGGSSEWTNALPFPIRTAN